ncbi:MAG: hypothetical protein U0795_25170 [Pirellulales bacterium]
MTRRRKHGRRGHYCWACDRIRANERFTGRGHARHVCRDCLQLGTQELAYRQAVRNLESCLDFDGLIVGKHRQAFERFKQHEDSRIRALAAAVKAHDQETRAMLA